MNQVEKAPFGIWTSAFSEETCNLIIEAGKQLKSQQATVSPKKQKNTKLRQGKISYFEKDSWIDNLLLPYVFRTNKLNKWNFNIDDSEPIQFTEYNKKDFYTWHRDSSVNVTPQRKLSITIQLSKRSNYKGGNFKIKNMWGNTEIEIPSEANEQGSIIIFPSFLLHQVTPVTSGTRYSLVQWYNGPPFT